MFCAMNGRVGRGNGDPVPPVGGSRWSVKQDCKRASARPGAEGRLQRGPGAQLHFEQQPGVHRAFLERAGVYTQAQRCGPAQGQHKQCTKVDGGRITHRVETRSYFTYVVFFNPHHLQFKERKTEAQSG